MYSKYGAMRAKKPLSTPGLAAVQVELEPHVDYDSMARTPVLVTKVEFNMIY